MCFPVFDSLAETRSALLTSLDGLASDELFAIPSHAHGTGLCRNSRFAINGASARAGGLERHAVPVECDGLAGPTHRVDALPADALPPRPRSRIRAEVHEVCGDPGCSVCRPPPQVFGKSFASEK